MLRLALFLLLTLPLSAQVTVEAGKRILIPAPGATAVLSLDSGVATASLTSSSLSVVGVNAGDVRVVAIYPASVSEIRVHVSPSRPFYPPGFVAPEDRGNGSGSYEMRYSSDRMQLENVLDINNQGLLESSQLHVVSASLEQGAGNATFLPSAFYRITTESMDMTFLDQTVPDLPLTLQDVVLRGFHLRDGHWQVHGGFTTSADFSDVVVPIEKEFAAGISYTKYLNRAVRVIPGAYFLRSVDLEDGHQRSALLGSLLIKLDFSEAWKLQMEVAAGRGAGFAFQMDHSSTGSSLNATLADKSVSFPSVRTSRLPGLTGNFNWTQTLSARIGWLSGGSVDHIHLSTVEQDSGNAFAGFRLKASKAISLGSSVNYGSFSTPAVYSSKTLTLPQQVNFDRAHFGAGFQYQFATASHAYANGSGERQTLRLDIKRFQFGEFVDMQKDSISINTLTSQLPQVQRVLQRQAITVAAPEEVSALLRGTAFLQSLGVVKQPQLVTLPERVEEGVNVAWNSTGARPHQVNLSVFRTVNHYAGATSSDYNLTGSYVKEIGASNLLQFTTSVVQSSLSGTRQLTPVYSISLRHNFSRPPSMLSLDRNHSIDGTVFNDSRGHGSYEDGMEPLPQVTVVMDGKKYAMTDGLGGFRFAGLSAGQHRLQVRYKSERAHYFTTPQDTQVEAGSTINFGINFPSVELWGYVEDDAGNGLENIEVRVAGGEKPLSAMTDRSGKFLLPEVRPGSYQVEVNAESVAVGHDTEDLKAAEVLITDSTSTHPVIRIQSIRVLTGTVSTYDPLAGRYVPVKGALIEIVKPAMHLVTDGAGRFTVGSLPAGELELRITAGRSSLARKIRIPVQPGTIREDYRISALDGSITAASR